MGTYSITEGADKLGISRVRLATLVNRGYIGPQKHSGPPHPRELTDRDLRAAQIACALTDAGHRLLPKLGRDWLYKTADMGITMLLMVRKHRKFDVVRSRAKAVPDGMTAIEIPA